MTFFENPSQDPAHIKKLLDTDLSQDLQGPAWQGPKMPEQADAYPPSVGQSPYPSSLQKDMERVGITWDNFKANMVKGADALGLYEKDWDDQDVDWEIGFRRAAEVFDKDRSMASRIIADMYGTGGGGGGEQKQPKEGEQQSIEDTEKQNRDFATRQRMQELYGQLRDAPFMRTWWGVIAYVLLAATTKSPSFAARIMLHNPNREGTLMELQQLREQLKMDARNTEQEKSRENEMRRWAAAQMINRTNKRDSEENRLHRLWIKSQQEAEEARGKMPEDTRKKLEAEERDIAVEAHRAMDEGFDKMNKQWTLVEGKPHPAYYTYIDKIKQWNDVRAVLKGAGQRNVVETLRSYAPGTGK